METITVVTNSNTRKTEPVSVPKEGILRKQERSESSRAPDDNNKGARTPT